MVNELLTVILKAEKNVGTLTFTGSKQENCHKLSDQQKKRKT